MVRPVNQAAPAGFGRTGNNGNPPPVRNDRPPGAQPGSRPAIVEQPRTPEQARPAEHPTEARPAGAEPAKEATPPAKANEKKAPPKKGDKTEKKDR
jgi:hypothetical protein